MLAKRKKNTQVKADMTKCGHGHYGAHCGGGVYGLGFVGAAIFYIQQATGFWGGVVGVLKAIVWPAFLIHKLLGL